MITPLMPGDIVINRCTAAIRYTEEKNTYFDRWKALAIVIHVNEQFAWPLWLLMLGGGLARARSCEWQLAP